MKIHTLQIRQWGVLLCLMPALLLADQAEVVDRVGRDIEYLAADEMEGRGPGTHGLELAAKYVRDEFQHLGLTSGTPDGSYMQPFQVDMSTRLVKDKTSLRLIGLDDEDRTLELGKDYQALAVGGSGHAASELVFAGYGISAKPLGYDDYQGVDVKGKVVVILRREPQQNDPKSVFEGKKTTAHSYIQTKLKLAKQRGASAVLLVNDAQTASGDKGDQLAEVAGFGSRGFGVPFGQLTRSAVDRLLAASPVKTEEGDQLTSLAAIEQHIDESLQPVSAPLPGWKMDVDFVFEPVRADVANVIGVIEGEGPHANEAIILGAHYDHIGFGEFGSRYRGGRKVHNGADDNASGTAAIMELARRFTARGQAPARRMIFIGFSAEERGLIGSDYYIKHPVYPIAETVAMFNFDMIGQLRNDELTVFGARSAAQFPAMIERANASSGLKLKLPPNILRSGDHYGFYHAGVPAFHFFSGFTKQYHTPDDDFETLSIEGVVATVDYAERLLDAVLKMDGRPEYVKVESVPNRPTGVAYLGITPDYAANAVGVKVTTVMKDSPASEGGIQAGDVILRLAEIQVADFAALRTALQKHKPGEAVEILVKRGANEVTCKVELGSPPG